MKIRKPFLILVLILVLISFKNFAQETETKKPIPEFDFSELKNSKFPKPIGYVNDFEEIFTVEQKNKLERKLSDYEEQTTNEIAIITINSIEPYDNFSDYATNLSNDWGVGKVDKDNGLTIVISTNLKQIRISTGNGTEKTVTDEIRQNIIEQIIIPDFKNGNYYDGIVKGLAKLIAEWE